MHKAQNLIRFYRRQSQPKLTQAGLAKLLNVNKNTIGLWEKDGVADEQQLLRLITLFVEQGVIRDYETAQRFWSTSSRLTFAEPPELQQLFTADTPPAPSRAPLPEPPITSAPAPDAVSTLPDALATPLPVQRVRPKWLGYALAVVMLAALIAGVVWQRSVDRAGELSVATTQSEQCSNRMAQRLEALSYPHKWWTDTADPRVIVGTPRFDDLRYFEQGSSQPPRPGDLVVWQLDGDERRMLIDRMAGNWIQAVLQSANSEVQCIQLNLSRDVNGSFRISDGQGKTPFGWVHSKKMEFVLSPQRDPRTVEGTYTQLRWSQDADSVYIYISQEFVQRLAEGAVDLENSLGGTMLAADSHGILSQTTAPYSECVARKVIELIRTDERFNPDHGISSVDYTLKYAGDHIWVRPWGGSQHKRWIEIGSVVCGPK